ncbi:hypothetical protein F5Y18DRAFT_417127 [Xylariaceae sp. FL1019]|nr:hypothetical protein F5Y18DRAFT_417127 [Xylariaceae sp. FL1019]
MTSSSLWQCYWENDIDKFRRLLQPAGSHHTPSKATATGLGSPAAFGSSPRSLPKFRRASGLGPAGGASKGTVASLGKAEVNSRDHCGLTLLLRAASSTSPCALDFAQALLDHTAIDIYIQDPESGWNALHRALYNGNISIARLLLDKERRDLVESVGLASNAKIGQLIKTKDNEGNSPFDLYNATIALRSLKAAEDHSSADDGSEPDEGVRSTESQHPLWSSGLGGEVFTFGSNNNLSLGLGDEDDRQFPERIYLKRTEHLVRYFHEQHIQQLKDRSMLDEPISHDIADIPALVQNRPLIIQDVVLAKLHSAILTTDPISNLYISGIGRGGRLGLGDENTQFSFMPVQGGLVDKKVTQIALGQNHTMAITNEGELWTWGSNTHAQLGYALPPPLKPDEDPISTTPRQVFGPLKKEVIAGVAASSIHSVVHTGSSLFCWGKNVGQLGLMDADSRSLELQAVPRKVAATLISSHSSVVSAVSAIDRATCCLFGDRSLVVFTSYGYKMINIQGSVVSASLAFQQSVRLSSTPYDSKRQEIHQIASGGDTIAAVTGSGDLFTMQLSQKLDSDQLSASTTNPAKIKDAITAPQCIWTSRKDGVNSVGVGEHGSVIISTQSGAVWRRIKRVKARDTKAPAAQDSKRKAFKFQRVPYITDVVCVRSSAFGAYAAVRKDCDVTRDQLEIQEPTLWQDVGRLLPLQDFKAQNYKLRENKGTQNFQNGEKLKSQMDGLTYEILTSTDLEDDLAYHFRNWKFGNENPGAAVRSVSDPHLALPVHTWLLSARSAVLRMGLQRFRETGQFQIPELLAIKEEAGEIIVEFVSGIDTITLINLVVYMYRDGVVPAWNFTRQSPPLAYRYRQIRTELMKIATRLEMPKLEAAARTQTYPPRSMNKDFRKALEDAAFFEDGDALLELDGDEIPVHSSLLCQRCPWFEGLFNGRSRGKWLEGRRATQDNAEPINIDMLHMDPESFHYVLQFLYADVGEDLFDSVVADNIDEFSELVMDVMSIANELMLDRLSQICQKILGRFVSTRNISTLMNLISPCSVTEFKKKGLEYICLQMEAMLENHLLDNLDDELLLDLDEVVKDNQLARCPFAKSGHSEALLHEQNPDLAQDILEERQIRVKEMAFKTNHRDDDKKISSSYKARVGSLDDLSGISPTPDRTQQRKPSASRNEPFSPVLRPKDSQTDLIFDMDEEENSSGASPLSPSPEPAPMGARDGLDRLSSLSLPRRRERSRMPSEPPQILSTPPVLSPSSNVEPLAMKSESDVSRRASGPWKPSALPTARLDLREVLAEAKPVQSALSAGLAATNREAGTRSTPQKVSQREKKKQLQQQAEQTARQEAESKTQSQIPWSNVGEKKSHPWKGPAPIPKSSIPALLSPDSAAAAKPPDAGVASSSKSIARRAASPDTRFPGQRSNTAPLPSTSKGLSRAERQPLTPHSKSYIKRTPKQEQDFGLGLADIIGQQQREQQSHKEAVAKRSLQEIQEEQAFQEWWDQESNRVKEEEARRQAREENKDKKREGGKRGRGGRSKGRGGGGGGGGNKESGIGVVSGRPAQIQAQTRAQPQASSSAKGKGRANRGGRT